jgi:hypothetical protein
VSFSGDTNTGIYSPGADQVAISTNGTGRLFINSAGNAVLGSSTVQAFTGYTSLTLDNATNGGVLCINKNAVNIANISATGDALTIDAAGGGTSPIVFRTGAATTERMRLDSSGRLGLGTSSPGAPLDVVGSVNTVVLSDSTTNAALKQAKIQCRHYTSSEENLMMLYAVSDSSASEINIGGGSSAQNYATQIGFWTAANNTSTTGTERLRITSAGLVGIGTTSPDTSLTISYSDSAYNPGIKVTNTSNTSASQAKIYAVNNSGEYIALIRNSGALGGGSALFSTGAAPLAFSTDSTERARIDSSGRLLVGTSTARTNFNTGAEQSHIQLEGTTFNTSNLSIVRNSANDGTAALTLGKSRSATVNGNTVVVSGDPLGFINFEGADGTNMVRGASITAQVDGTPGTNDMPGRLVFSTTADGASSPTERMRIRNDGHIVTYDFGSLANPTTGMVAARGFSTRTGINGSYVGNAFNFNWTGNLVAYIDSTNIGNVTLTSDYRIKRNIEDQAGEAIARIKQLRPVTYQRADYGDLIKGDDRVREGFIAHEVAEVIPSGVEGEKDAENQVQSLNIDAIVSVLTKALQEAVAKIETLEAKVAALEAS